MQIKKNWKAKHHLPRHRYQPRSQVTYIICILDDTTSGEPMAYKTVTKINSRLNFQFGKKYFFDTRPKMALMQRSDLVAF